MFNSLSPSRFIYVTGPQRSGTTICARIIEHDLNFTYVDEEDYGIHEQDSLKEFIEGKEKLVIHCPGLARWIHEIATEEDAVIWLRRPVAEIVKSQQRIQWDDTKERNKYLDVPHLNLKQPMSEVKNEYWKMQRKQIENYMEVRYNDLKSHELFVHNRKGFKARQWIR